MVDTILKKLATEHGMKIAKGVAYGSLHGYAATLSVNNSLYQLVITTRFETPAMQDALRQELNHCNVSSEFKVRNISFASNGINITFTSSMGIGKKIAAFIDWFMPLLSKHGASQVQICTECGQPIMDGGSWILRNGAVAFHVHSACAQKVRQGAQDEHARHKEEDTGSYLQGTLGAIGGAAIGAILWALVYMMNYIAAIVGFVIGFLAEKGYNLLHGKQGKGKVAILIIATIIGVALGNAAGLVASTMAAFAEDGMAFGVGETIEIILLVLQADPEIMGEVLRDMALGIFFAILGVTGLIAKTNREVSAEKIVTLE